MSIALARKYRPKTFAEVAVQSHVSTTLQGAIASGRVAHGYLLCGPRGVGKTTLARVLAMALNCERRTPAGEPCGECTSCKRIWAGSASLDVVEIDAASNRGVDDARDLRERAQYAPSGDDRYKVYIVDEAHMLTREAWNALLKILEEPPPRVVFVFATTEPQRITQAAAPVMSRLQRFDLRRIGAADIRARLTAVLAAEHVTADPDALALIARAADGSMRDALSLVDQVLSLGGGTVDPARVRDALGLVPEDEYLELLTLIAERRAADVFTFVGRLADAGADFSTFLVGFGDTVRAQLTVALGGQPADVSERMREALVAGKNRFVAADLVRMLTALTELEPRFRRSGQQQLLIETFLVRMALLDRTVDVEALLRGLGSPAPAPASAPKIERDRIAPPSVTSAPRASGPPLSVPLVTEPRTPSARRATEPALEAPRMMAPARVPSVEATDRPAVDQAGLTVRWNELVARLHAEGKSLLATALEHATPTVSGPGEIGLSLDESNDFYAKAIQSNGGDAVTILREWFHPVQRLSLRAAPTAPSGPAAPPKAPPKRLTDEMVRAEKLEALKRDPTLAAAIDALDLEVVD